MSNNAGVKMSGSSHDNAVFIMDDVQVPPEIKVESKSNNGLTHHDHLFTTSHERGKFIKVKPQPKPKHGRNQHHQSMIDTHETVTLTWEDVNVSVIPPNRACCRGPDPNFVPKQVLKNVYGMVQPGTLMAIMGASGSGKTTLMNTLTERINKQSLSASGDIRVNGLDVGMGIRNISAYVQQDDMFIATMTVKEHLTFRALLRMDKSVPNKRRLERVDEVIQELGLTKCQDNIIGNPGRIKGISGGEMRRLSFAAEILTNPPLLFCDEPTSGLDSFMAENIVMSLKDMASKGKTILCTIHQPSSEVYALFDTLLLMAEGRVAYLGPSKDALSFFSNSGYPCPVNFNPADFYIKTMAVVPGSEQECRKKITELCDKFDQTEASKGVRASAKRIADNPKRTGVIFEEAFSNTSMYEAAWYTQFKVVFKRSLLTAIREPMVIRVRLIQTVALAVVLGLIYLQLELDQEGVMNFNGVIFLYLTQMTFSNVFGVLNTFPIEVPIFLRDYGIGLYRVDIYFICKILSELPSFIFIPIIFSAIVYWMVGMYASFEAFVIFTGILILVANISASFGYIVSTAADSVNTALAVAPPLMIPLLMFGGFFLNSDSIPVYFIWLEYLSWFKYANELLSINQWQNIDSIDCGSGERCLFNNGSSVIDYLNFDKDNTNLDIGLLFALLIAYRIIAFVILVIKARRSKK